MRINKQTNKQQVQEECSEAILKVEHNYAKKKRPLLTQRSQVLQAIPGFWKKVGGGLGFCAAVVVVRAVACVGLRFTDWQQQQCNKVRFGQQRRLWQGSIRSIVVGVIATTVSSQPASS